MFAFFGSLVSLMGVTSIFMGFGYHNVVLITKDKKELSTVFTVILASLLISVILLVLLVCIIHINFSGFLNIDKYTGLILILSSLGHGLYLYFNSISLKFGLYKQIAFSRVLRVAVNKGFVIISGLFFTISGLYLLIGELLGTFFIVLVLLLVLNKRGVTRINLRVDELVRLVHKYSSFPKYVMTSDLLFRLRKWLILTTLLYFFAPENIGLYVFGTALLAIPTNVLSTAIGEVYFKEVANASYKRIQESLISGVPIMLISGSIIYFTLSAIDDSVITWVFGSNWKGLMVCVAALSLQFFSEFVVAPIMGIEKATGHEKNVLRLHFSSLLFSMVGLLIGYHLNGFIYSLYGLSIGICISNLCALLTILKRYELRLWFFILRYKYSFLVVSVGKLLLTYIGSDIADYLGIDYLYIVLTYAVIAAATLYKLLNSMRLFIYE